MIKANELRIGNYLNFKNTKDVAVVDLIHSKNYFDCRDEYGSFIPNGNYQPIPLTEEWLIKFRFEKIGFNFRKLYNIRQGLGEFVLWKNTSTGIFCFKAINQLIEVKTVHRLQNCFLDITEEELTLKQ